jgi:serine protease Do
MPWVPSLAQEQPPLQLVESSVHQSLVQIRTVDSKTFQQGDHTITGSFHSQGLGVIIDSNGIIVTNTHVVIHAPHIFVGLSDGTVLEATVIYSSDADFSFLKIDPPYPLRPIVWADSSQATIGTTVFAISNADGDEQHVVGGAITNLINGISNNNVELLELNLNLYQGDSGGPLLDDQGHLLGLITAKRMNEVNKSYAIASNKIRQEFSQYKGNS